MALSCSSKALLGPESPNPGELPPLPPAEEALALLRLLYLDIMGDSTLTPVVRVVGQDPTLLFPNYTSLKKPTANPLAQT